MKKKITVVALLCIFTATLGFGAYHSEPEKMVEKTYLGDSTFQDAKLLSVKLDKKSSEEDMLYYQVEYRQDGETKTQGYAAWKRWYGWDVERDDCL
ncbi:MAG: hypothetical protein E7280_04740 [Lachnospiraceae bacterium]|nr:hypothetical protein [Lachnospiraceae bacterium]